MIKCFNIKKKKNSYSQAVNNFLALFNLDIRQHEFMCYIRMSAFRTLGEGRRILFHTGVLCVTRRGIRIHLTER